MKLISAEALQAIPFAHLLGINRKPAAAAPTAQITDDDDRQKDGESDEDYKKRKDAKKAKGESEQQDEEASQKVAQPAQPAADPAPPAQPAAAAPAAGTTDDDSDEEMRGTGPLAQARIRERARCAAIFGCAAAGIRPDVAASLAFNTRMTRAEAITTLESVSAGNPAKASSLQDRMQAEAKITTAGPGGAEADPSNPQDASAITAAAIIQAGKKRRAEA